MPRRRTSRLPLGAQFLSPLSTICDATDPSYTRPGLRNQLMQTMIARRYWTSQQTTRPKPLHSFLSPRSPLPTPWTSTSLSAPSSVHHLLRGYQIAQPVLIRRANRRYCPLRQDGEGAEAGVERVEARGRERETQGGVARDVRAIGGCRASAGRAGYEEAGSAAGEASGFCMMNMFPHPLFREGSTFHGRGASSHRAGFTHGWSSTGPYLYHVKYCSLYI